MEVNNSWLELQAAISKTLKEDPQLVTDAVRSSAATPASKLHEADQMLGAALQLSAWANSLAMSSRVLAKDMLKVVTGAAPLPPEVTDEPHGDSDSLLPVYDGPNALEDGFLADVYSISQLGDAEYMITYPDASTLSYYGEYPVVHVWREFREQLKAGRSQTDRCVIRLEGDGGAVCVGHGYNDGGANVISNVGGEIKLHIIGLGSGSTLGLAGIGDKYGFVAEFGTYSLNTWGANDDSFIQRQHGRVGHILRVNCGFKPGHVKGAGHLYTSGCHYSHGFDSLLWTKERDLGAKFREHLFYFEDCTNATGLFILNNLLQGGNRCAFQVRCHKGIPGDDAGNPISGPIVIAGNKSDSFGWDHENPDGGAVISVWSNPHHVTFIFDNEIRNCRYGGIMVSDQAPEKNWLNGNGFPVKAVLLKDNTVVGSDRDDLSLSGVGIVDFLEDNDFGTVVINSKWSAEHAAGIQCGTVMGDVPAHALTYVDGEMQPWIS